MADPTAIGNDRICFGDLEIMIMTGDSALLAERDDIYYMMKSEPYIGSYRQVRQALGRPDARNVLEVGVFRGGSAPFLHRFFDAQRLVCIDRVDGVPPLDRYAREQAPALSVHYGVDQADKAALRRIVAADFAAPIDLVVDDASHLYGPTKATFEAIFPYVRPGGVFVIEDWSWSHGEPAQRPDHFWADQDSPSSLVFELVAAYGASENGLLSSIGFAPGLMWVVKGWLDVPKDGFRLDEFTNLRGRSLQLM